MRGVELYWRNGDAADGEAEDAPGSGLLCVFKCVLVKECGSDAADTEAEGVGGWLRGIQPRLVRSYNA